jgi:hypothetical protein
VAVSRALVLLARSPLGNRLHVYDLDRKAVVLSRTVFGRSASHRPYLAAEGILIIQAEGGVRAKSFDGRTVRELWHAPPGTTITGVSISPDRSAVAIGYESDPLFVRERSGLVVVRIADGQVLREFGPELFDLLRAAPAPLVWQDGGSELVPQAVTHTEWGRFGWARLDGSYGSLPFNQYMATDRSGTFSAFGDGLLGGCADVRLAARTIAIVDTRTGRTVSTLSGGDQTAYDVLAVSPDGRALVAQYPVSRNEWGACIEFRYDLFVWDGSAREPIADPLGVMLSFWGLPDVRLECPNEADERWHRPSAMACSSNPDGELRVDGRAFGRLSAVEILGVVER